MGIFKLLEKYHRKEFDFHKSETFKFFLENRHILTALEKISYVKENEKDDFMIIRDTILIHGLNNKKIIEDHTKALIAYIKSNNRLEFTKKTK